MMALIFTLAFDRGFLAERFQDPRAAQARRMSYAIYIGQTALLQLLRHAQLHLYPAPDDIVFGRPWAAWEPIWHWLEPALLVAAAILWGWLLFTLSSGPPIRPCGAGLRGIPGAARRPLDASRRLGHHSPDRHVKRRRSHDHPLRRQSRHCHRRRRRPRPGHALDFAKRGAKVVVNDLGGAVDGTGGSARRRRRSWPKSKRPAARPSRTAHRSPTTRASPISSSRRWMRSAASTS
jgi:hypothetical protein